MMPLNPCASRAFVQNWWIDEGNLLPANARHAKVPVLNCNSILKQCQQITDDTLTSGYYFLFFFLKLPISARQKMSPHKHANWTEALWNSDQLLKLLLASAIRQYIENIWRPELINLWMNQLFLLKNMLVCGSRTDPSCFKVNTQTHAQANMQ